MHLVSLDEILADNWKCGIARYPVNRDIITVPVLGRTSVGVVSVLYYDAVIDWTALSPSLGCAYDVDPTSTCICASVTDLCTRYHIDF